MKAERDRSEEVVADQVGKAHQGAVVVGDALRALEAPNRAAEDLAEVPKAMHVRVVDELRDVVVDESVAECVEIRHPSEQEQPQDGQGVGTGTSSRVAARSPHEVILLERRRGIYARRAQQ